MEEFQASVPEPTPTGQAATPSTDAITPQVQPEPSPSTVIVPSLRDQQPWQVRLVLIVKKPNDKLSSAALLSIARYLRERGIDFIVDPSAALELEEERLQSYSPNCPELLNKVDLVVSIGGDGTLLHVSQLFPDRCPPILPLNAGTLGFLTPFSVSEAIPALEGVIQGRFFLSSRLRLQARVVRRTGRVLENQFIVLNEVVVDRGYSSYLTNLEVWVDGQHVTTIQADGCILSTSTGSTAYCISANGPVLHPGVPAMVLTSICPHSLSCRPVVLPGTCQVVFRVSPSARGTSWAAFDSRCRLELAREDSLVVQASPWPLPTICRTDPSYDFFHGLKSLFFWNERPIQKPLEQATRRTQAPPSALPVTTVNSGEAPPTGAESQ